MIFIMKGRYKDIKPDVINKTSQIKQNENPMRYCIHIFYFMKRKENEKKHALIPYNNKTTIKNHFIFLSTSIASVQLQLYRCCMSFC